MKQTLLFTLSFFTSITLMTACSTGQVADEMAVVGNPSLASDPCAAIDEKVMKLDRFTEVVKNTSAFHLEEKANAIPTPGITVSNNRKQMLKDAKRKYAEYEAERQKYSCETPEIKDQTTDAMPVSGRAALSTGIVAATEKKAVTTTTSTSTRVVDTEESTAVLTVAENTPGAKQKEAVKTIEKKDTETSTARQTSNVETPVTASTAQMDDKITASDNATFSSEKCNTLDEELIELSEFTTMVKNTSAFHLEEKASALPSPGFTVSNNKKKMLRDIEKRYAELLKERKKYGCEPL